MRSHGTGLPLFADLYELTMLHAYWASGMTEEATFSLFVRKLPPGRNFLLACGLAGVLENIERMRFSRDDLAYLRSLGQFPEDFLSHLAGFRFTGDIHALPEGTPFLPQEPIVEVVAPIGQAQLLETFLMNQIGLQTILASKAQRIVRAAQGRPVVDFGSRRAQGVDAAMLGARAFAIAGVSATSNLRAGQALGMPVTGTVAHSFVEAFAVEEEAFRALLRVYPSTILLVDTYDTLAAVRVVAQLAQPGGPAESVAGIRLDSGNLADLARASRAILDEAGLPHLRIFASGGIDEARIAGLLASGAPIDAFGVGTAMSVSEDAPALDIAYKLTEYAGLGRMKLSTDKVTLPGRKQVFREVRDGLAVSDTLALAHETLPGTPLLCPVMKAGRILPGVPRDWHAIRDATDAALALLPARITSLGPAQPPYAVGFSADLMRAEAEVRARVLSQPGRPKAG